MEEDSMRIVTPRQAAAALADYWSPRVIGEIDDSYVKVAKLKGTLAWHRHPDEDELFLVLTGRLRIEMDDKTVELGEGDLFVVPRGVRHNPVADVECCVLLIEKKSTAHTGDVITDKTRTIEQQLGQP